MRWHPITTYRPDPNPVLLFWPYWSAVPVIGEFVRQVTDEGGFEAGGVWWTEKWLGDDATDPGPTHWMPLPDPPAPGD